jgi:hypothetical protein
VRVVLSKAVDRNRATAIESLEARIASDKLIIQSLRDENLEMDFRHQRQVSRLKADIAVDVARMVSAEGERR